MPDEQLNAAKIRDWAASLKKVDNSSQGSRPDIALRVRLLRDFTKSSQKRWPVVPVNTEAYCTPGSAARQQQAAHQGAAEEELRDQRSRPPAYSPDRTRHHHPCPLLTGLLYSSWVVDDEELSATDRRELVACYGALLRHVLTPTS